MMTNWRAKSVCLLAAGWLGAASPGWAEGRVEVRRPASPEGVVAIEVGSGKLRVVAWDKPEVAVTGSVGQGVEGVDVDSHARRVTIALEGGHGPGGGESELEISVPARSALEIEAFSADTSVSGVKGAVQIESVNGNVAVHAGGGALDLNSVNGRIEVDGAPSRVRAEGVNGAVALRGVSGDVEASTVNGELSVEGGALTAGRFETVSGTLKVNVALADDARLALETVSGTVELTLPSGSSARFALSSFSGSIQSELGGEAKRTSRYTQESELDFVAGDGKATVDVRTLSGSIQLRKR
jgi:hypothetical protein